MQFALSTYQFADERLNSHILDQIAGAGFRELEIFAARQHLDYSDPRQVRDVAQWFFDHGVTLTSLHAPLFTDEGWGRRGGLPVSVAYLERRLRINSMDEIKRATETAERLPFRYLIVPMGLPGEEYDPPKFDAAFTSLEHLKIFAKARGAELLLENVPSQLSTPERLLEFLAYTRLELKLCFDTGHAHMIGGVHPAFESLKGLVVCAHLHDNHREKDEHLMPFDGDIDWKQALRDLRALPNGVPMVFELRDYGPGVTTLPRVLEVMERMKGMC
jgi:sugar phosphate isomerase/epimerase